MQTLFFIQLYSQPREFRLILHLVWKMHVCNVTEDKLGFLQVCCVILFQFVSGGDTCVRGIINLESYRPHSLVREVRNIYGNKLQKVRGKKKKKKNFLFTVIFLPIIYVI